MTNPIGFLFAGIAVLCFGSNFVVTKKYKTGDGMFFQWTMTSGIFIMGIFFYLYQCGTLTYQGHHMCPTFQPFAMLGGALWATGNICTVPIVKTIGLSLGLLVWGMANMVIGWASARFGILGSFAGSISSPALNSVGVGIAVLSMGVFYFIKPSVENAKSSNRGQVSVFKSGKSHSFCTPFIIEHFVLIFFSLHLFSAGCCVWLTVRGRKRFCKELEFR